MEIYSEILAKNENFAQCDRCRKYTPECGYDKKKGFLEILCNRCQVFMEENFPDHVSYKKFKTERS